MDFSHSESPFSQSQDAQARRSIQECIAAIVMILETVDALIENGQCYGSFWSTQYIALVAISTLYVLMIQGARRALPGNIKNFLNVEDCLKKARHCHDHLGTLPPAGSQAQRHHVLLSHLRSKAERSLAKTALKITPAAVQPLSDTSLRINNEQTNNTNSANNTNDANKAILNNRSLFNPPLTVPTNMTSTELSYPPSVNNESGPAINEDPPNDMLMFGSMLTPNSNSDDSFQYMLLDYGWESLDTIGAMRGPEGMFGLGT